jgi:hypothetical protein
MAKLEKFVDEWNDFDLDCMHMEELLTKTSAEMSSNIEVTT